MIRGKKKVYRKAGYVADFCRICRSSSTFLLRRVGRAKHVCHIAWSQGDLLGYERTCQTCKTSYKAEQIRYPSISKKKAHLDVLQRETFPDLENALKDRLALEDKVKRSALQLSAGERIKLIREPFVLLSPKVEKYFASAHVDVQGFVSILAAWGLIIGSPILVREFAPEYGQYSLPGSVLFALLLVASQVMTAGSRYMRREIVPLLARALRPVKPDADELASVLKELKQAKQKIASKLNPKDLKKHLPSLR
jgi:hypothetical protein